MLMHRPGCVLFDDARVILQVQSDPGSCHCKVDASILQVIGQADACYNQGLWRPEGARRQGDFPSRQNDHFMPCSAMKARSGWPGPVQNRDADD